MDECVQRFRGLDPLLIGSTCGWNYSTAELCFSVALVYPCCLTAPTGCSCILVNFLFSLRFLVIWDAFVKCPTLSHQFHILDFLLAPDTWKVSVFPQKEIVKEFPHGEGRIIPNKEQNSTPETKDQSSLGEDIWKIRLLRWVRTWTDVVLEGLPHHQQYARYLRLCLDSSKAKPTAGLCLCCQLSQSAADGHCQGTTWHHAYLPKALKTALQPQPQQAMLKPDGVCGLCIYSFLPYASMAEWNHPT